MKLQHKSVIVTGGSRGIGEATVLAFAREKANVAIAAVGNMKEAEEVAHKVEEMGGKAIVHSCDVSKAAEVQQMVDRVVQEWKSIDVLVHCAGIAHNVPAEDLSLHDWQRMIDINLTGTFLCNQAVGKKMIAQKKGGAIVNIASMSGHIVNVPQKQCHYNASKAGVIMLTKSLAVEWAEHAIRVNSISPGYIGTKLVEKASHLHAAWIEKIPMKKMGEPEDVAYAAVYLASSRAKFVTGSDWIIDGGYVCI